MSICIVGMNRGKNTGKNIISDAKYDNYNCVFRLEYVMLNCVGLFTGKGSVCNTYLGSNPNPMEIVRMFNFDDEICARFAAFVLFLYLVCITHFLKCLSSFYTIQ